MKSRAICANLRTLRITFSNAWMLSRRLITRFGGCFVALTLLLGPLAAAEKPASDRVESALAEAERFATAGKWREALAAGDRLRKACRDLRGELHPDTALAELFLGEVRSHRGERSLAEAHFRRALAIQEQVLPRDAPELVTTLTRLGAELKEQRRHAEAAGLLRRALELQTRLHGEDEGTAVACINLARVLRHQREFSAAAALLDRALVIQRKELGGSAPETLTGLRELALLREAAAQLPAAELAAAEWTAGAEVQYGAESVEHLTALLEWARFAAVQGNDSAAESRYRPALAIAEQVFAPDAPELARVIAALGGCLLNLNRPAEAKPLLGRALELRRKLAGADDPDSVESLLQLGRLHRLQNDFAAARPCFEQALASREKTLGPNAPATLESLAELGDLLRWAGDFDGAAELHERRRYRLEETTGPDSAETAAAFHALAIVYESAKRWTQATGAALRSLKLTEQRHGAAAPETLDELLLLSRICEAAGALEPALAQYARLAAWFAQHPEAPAEIRAKLQRSHAIAAARANRSDAEELFRESRRIHLAVFGASHPETLRTLSDLWTFYVQTLQSARAVEVARELATETERALGSDSPAAAEVWERFGQLQITLGNREAAMMAIRRSLASRSRRAGELSPETLDALRRTAVFFEDVRDFARAAELRADRLELVRRKFSAGSAEEAAAAGELGMDYFRLRDFLPARGMFEHQRALSGNDAGLAAFATARLGDVALAAGDLAAALRERARLVTECERHFGKSHSEHGRALLLLGEAQVSAEDMAGAESSLGAAQRILALARTDDPLLTRVAADRAVVALRQGREDEARRWTRDALSGAMVQDEAMAEALSRLGDAWIARGDETTAESALAGALTILTLITGDHDEPALALLQRVGRMRMKRGRPGAAELFERALAGAEGLYGRESAEVAELLGWVALAQNAAGAHENALATVSRRVAVLERNATAGAAILAEARWMQAWLSWRSSGAEPAWAELADGSTLRWPWLALWRGALGW